MEEEEISAAYNRLFETEETREIEKKKIASNLQLCQTGCRLRTAADADCIRQALRPDEQPTQGYKTGNHAPGAYHQRREQSHRLGRRNESKTQPSSVLLYPSSFKGAEERKVFLSGEAFFDIRHDDAQPFHVSTPHFEITDLGTSFYGFILFKYR